MAQCQPQSATIPYAPGLSEFLNTDTYQNEPKTIPVFDDYRDRRERDPSMTSTETRTNRKATSINRMASQRGRFLYHNTTEMMSVHQRMRTIPEYVVFG